MIVYVKKYIIDPVAAKIQQLACFISFIIENSKRKAACKLLRIDVSSADINIHFTVLYKQTKYSKRPNEIISDDHLIERFSSVESAIIGLFLSVELMQGDRAEFINRLIEQHPQLREFINVID